MSQPRDHRRWFENLKSKGMNLGLERTKEYCDALEIQWPEHIIHVAGSNGKGSTCAYMVKMLEDCNISTLFFSSPHLIRVEERIRYRGCPISPSLFDHMLEYITSAIPDIKEHITYFEMTYLVSICCLSHLDVDVLILETGLGGRLDATRTAPATCSLLTQISLEHVDILGPTIVDIAREKAGIARPCQPIFVRRPQLPEVEREIERVTQQPHIVEIDQVHGPANLTFIDLKQDIDYGSEAKTLALYVLNNYFDIHDLDPKFAVNWPGRNQRLKYKHLTFILEGAHNPSGMKKSLFHLETVLDHNYVLIFGSSPQDSLDDMIRPLVQFIGVKNPLEIILTCPEKGRYPAIQPHLLAHYFEGLGIRITQLTQPFDALEHLFTRYQQPCNVLVIGSLYLQGNVLQHLGYDTDEHLSIQ